jgi:hypothetical protein
MRVIGKSGGSLIIGSASEDCGSLSRGKLSLPSVIPPGKFLERWPTDRLLPWSFELKMRSGLLPAGDQAWRLWFETAVYFASGAEFPRNVVGRHGWLHNFRVGIIDQDCLLLLSQYHE